jgi:hypothetical protein
VLIGTGLLPEWLQSGAPLGFGPTPTPAGIFSVRIDPAEKGLQVRIEGEGAGEGPDASLEIRIPGYRPVVGARAGRVYHLQKEGP